MIECGVRNLFSSWFLGQRETGSHVLRQEGRIGLRIQWREGRTASWTGVREPFSGVAMHGEQAVTVGTGLLQVPAGQREGLAALAIV